MKLAKDNLLIIHILIAMTVVSFMTIAYIGGLTLVVLSELNNLNRTENITIVYVTQPQVDETDVMIEPKPVVKKEIVKDIPKPQVKSKVVEKEHKHPHVHKVKETPKKAEVKTNGDAYLLAQIINAEAKGEPYNGKIAVGNVIMNRVNSPNFPDTIEGVIFQKGQFYPVTSGSINNKPSKESIQAAKEVLNGAQIVGKQALYFYNPNTSTSDWIFSRKTIMDIGNHRFAY